MNMTTLESYPIQAGNVLRHNVVRNALAKIRLEAHHLSRLIAIAATVIRKDDIREDKRGARMSETSGKGMNGTYLRQYLCSVRHDVRSQRNGSQPCCNFISGIGYNSVKQKNTMIRRLFRRLVTLMLRWRSCSRQPV